MICRSIKVVKVMIAAGLCALLIAAGGCAKPKAKETQTVTVGFQSWVGYGPIFLARDKGFDREEGVNLMIVNEPIDSARRDAFDLCMLDAEMGTIDLLASKRAQGTLIVGVCVIDASNGADGIVASEGISKIEDLAGKRVAYAVGDAGDTFMSYVLSEKGLSIKDVITVPAGPDDAYDYFLRKEADAVATWEPYLSKAKKRSGAHLLVSSKEKHGIIMDTLNVREDLVNNDPLLVKKIIRIWFKSVIYYTEHPDEASRIIAGYYGISPEEYRAEIAGLDWEDYKAQLKSAQNGEWQAIFDKIARLKYSAGRFKSVPDAESAFNLELLKRLYEDKN